MSRRAGRGRGPGAAAELCRLRDAWLNPTEWTREEMLEFPATVGGPWERFIVKGLPTDGSVAQRFTDALAKARETEPGATPK